MDASQIAAAGGIAATVASLLTNYMQYRLKMAGKDRDAVLQDLSNKTDAAAAAADKAHKAVLDAVTEGTIRK